MSCNVFFFFLQVLNLPKSGHVIVIFGNHVTATTSGKMATYYRNINQITYFKEKLASEVGLPPPMDPINYFMQQQMG